MKSLVLIFFTLILITSKIFAQDTFPKVIYGQDNRKDLFEVENPLYRQLSQATAALFGDGNVSPMTNGLYFITSLKYGEAWELCPSERFFEQRIGAFCSAFLVAPDIMATAGHCIVDQEECSRMKVVFNYAYDAPTRRVEYADKKDVYRCQTLLHRKYSKRKIDFALIKLDRPVQGITPLSMNVTGKIDPTAEFVVMGYPSGLPLKITDGAFLRKDKSSKGFFRINSDTYAGNSGSAVINAKSGLVEGILVRGARDFTFNRAADCYQSRLCKENSCRGEDVTSVSAFSSLL